MLEQKDLEMIAQIVTKAMEPIKADIAEVKTDIAELKADGFALDFAFCYLKSAYFNENHVYGIHMFTGVYIPLLASQQLCNNIFLGTNSHPALITRLVGVQRGLHKIIDESAWRETQHYRNTLCQLIDFPLNSIQN